MKKFTVLICLAAGSAALATEVAPPAATAPTTAAAVPATAPSATGPATSVAATPVTLPSTMASTNPSTRPLAAASTAPSTAPTTLATTAPATRAAYAVAPPAPYPAEAPRAMPIEYAILTRRSIFLKGQQRVYDRGVAIPGNGPGGPGSGDAASTTAPSFGQDSASPEHVLVFNGVTEADEEMAAFIEDTSNRMVKMVKVGDPIAFGKITGITLDTLTYEANGKTTEVAIGHNLEGGVTIPSSGGTVIATTGPSSEPSAAPSAADPNSILERLKRKRAAELGGR